MDKVAVVDNGMNWPSDRLVVVELKQLDVEILMMSVFKGM